MKPINGKVYPMWDELLLKRKAKWIGGTLKEKDSMFGWAPTTEIMDVSMEPNGTDSALVKISGKDYTASWDVQYAGITAANRLEGLDGFIEIYTQFGSTFYIKEV